MKEKHKQKGFTLIELAIVLVIIGIILGAILKGQELIKNAQAKRVQNDMRGLEAAVWTFYDRYGRFPGDCNRNGIIDARVYTTTTVSSLNNTPAAQFCGTSATDDPDMPWAELKVAYILNNVDNRQLSLTQFNGRFFIGYANAGTGTINANAVAVADIPCFAAKMIDVSIDGAANSGLGRVRALISTSVANKDDDADWTSVCDDEMQNVDLVYFFDRIP